MLEINKSISLIGNSKVGEKIAKVFDAKINEKEPENLVINSYIVDYELYKANRATITSEQTEFENTVYAIQESLTTGV